MTHRIIDITEFEKADSGSVVRLPSLSGDTHPFFADYDLLVVAVHAIACRAALHVSGPSGCGKSHFLTSLLFGPQEHFARVCAVLDMPRWPRLKCHRIFVSSYETPAEVFYRTEVVNFTTEERPQRILSILGEAAADPQTLHVVWLVESGRGVAACVEDGFLEVVGARIIREPRGQTFDTANVTFATDSNYSANEAGEFHIWDRDQAYARRWTRRMTFGGLSPEQEIMVLRELSPGSTETHLQQVMALAMGIRRKHEEGRLQSVLPPTLDVELDLLACLRDLPVNPQFLVFNTLLGHCAKRDRDEADTVFAEAFGVRIQAATPAAEAVGAL
ncbi:MAG: hypothetical protein JXQ71_06360 [Verrucomicrobia bacterium]|nr:hypothetical protein [Verrucomicrobiota bacterium]